MFSDILTGVLIPLVGTSAGAAGVFALKRKISKTLTDALSAIAAGIMTAASVWSLLLPSIDYSSAMGKLAFVPAVAGFLLGCVFMAVLRNIDGLLAGKRVRQSSLSNTFLAVTIHNFPEGMAVGTIYGAYLASADKALLTEGFFLALGIAIQNIPEGAIISMPLHAEGMKKPRAFAYGCLSGIVEPIGAIITIFALKIATVLLPYFLSFAAGCMVFVVTEQLIPDINKSGRVPIRGLCFAAGFVIMMSLDVMLG